MGSRHISGFEREADLCDLCLRDFSALPGWSCYPEASNFDVLSVHDDGRQLAKGTQRGHRIETEHMPAFDLLPPELYVVAVQTIASDFGREFSLS
uniref:hypothetical protein n=1 Tax=Pseudomonas fluorescens TaxID=294 RepID=UPI001867A904|nr:hypothetical protein [Pseudomonas fluorescens]